MDRNTSGRQSLSDTETQSGDRVSPGLFRGGSPPESIAGMKGVEWSFLIVSIVNILASMAMTIYRLVIVAKDEPDSPDLTFAILLLVNGVFCLYYTVHGLKREMKYEIYALIAAILVVMIYCILEYAVNDKGRTTVKLVRLICACALGLLNIFLAVRVAKYFGYLRFRIVGALSTFQDMYQETCRFSCLLELDLQASVSFVILVLENGTHLGMVQKLVLGVGLPVSLAWCLGGWICMRKELKWGIGIFAVVGLVAPAYVSYELYRVFMKLPASDEYLVLRICVVAAGALCILIRCLVYVVTYRIVRNFGQGLKERAFEPGEHTGLLAGPGSPQA